MTVCTAGKSRLYGQIREGKMILNGLGHVVEDCWQQISHVRNNVVLDAYVVMPNHVHGIIFLLNEQPINGAAEISGEHRDSARSLASRSLGAIIGQFKRAVTIKSKSLAQPAEQALWQRNYYDHIIRNEGSLNDIRKYIVENPVRWSDDSLFVE